MRNRESYEIESDYRDLKHRIQSQVDREQKYKEFRDKITSGLKPPKYPGNRNKRSRNVIENGSETVKTVNSQYRPLDIYMTRRGSTDI